METYKQQIKNLKEIVLKKISTIKGLELDRYIYHFKNELKELKELEWRDK